MQSLYIITGAGKGFGRSIAGLLKDASGKIALIGRNQERLDIAANQLKGWKDIECISLDLGALDTLESQLQAWKTPKAQWRHIYLFNNAGSLGPLARVPDLSAKAVRAAVDADVTGTIIFTSYILKSCVCPVTIINTSSLAAIQPFDTWSVYCSTKAARDMFHRAIAIEAQETCKPIRVLNYAPGPLDTDMQREIRETMPNVGLKAQFEQMHQNGALVSSDASAQKLIKLLEAGEWKNGNHIDFFD